MPRKINQSPEHFGANLRDFRKAAELTQIELAAKAGIGQGYLSDLEKGKKDLVLSLAVKLADILGKPLQNFLEKNL